VRPRDPTTGEQERTVVLTVLEGSTFCVSDDVGDISVGAEGVFAEDTRMLSRCRLLLDGASPLLLTSRAVDYFHAVHYLRNAPTTRLPPDTISISRERFVGARLAESLVVRNESVDSLRFDLALELAADFEGIISLKAREFVSADPLVAPPPKAEVPCAFADAVRTVRMSDGAGYSTSVSFSRAPSCDSGTVCFELALESHETWELTFEVSFGESDPPRSPSSLVAFETELHRVREALAAWKLRVPRLATPFLELGRAYERSIADLASLRLKGIEGIDELPAAGMPWFMTLFGRDTAITSLQTLLFGPELAVGALRSLAALQSDRDDPSIDAEPGKILHELRRGKTAEEWFPIYYGSLDSTPLFLVLLSEVWRWTGDDGFARELEGPARRAAEWIVSHGDRDGDCLLEYESRTPRGLANQSWKDSGDSQRFRDGRLAHPPIAPVEIQGYAYDALRRVAELARLAWGDPKLAVRLDAAATRLAERFDDAFWLEERQAYALALDGDKAPVDSLCSNIGYLLWSGIVPESRRAAIAQALVGDELWSGWGLRTMGAREAGYNPLSYHNGTVWPHDTAFAAWGLARSGFPDEARLLARSLLEAAGFFDFSLPEVFAGFSRTETALPVAYPTSARPQAWAAGAPVLCLRLLLGLEADRASGKLVTTAAAPMPDWLEGTVLEGVPALGRSWRVAVSDGAVEVHTDR
jgi:glycogen debranching enzyme